MTCENVLSQCFGKHISNLVICANREDLDEALANMVAKMMVADVDMFGTRAKLGEPSKFKGA